MAGPLFIDNYLGAAAKNIQVTLTIPKGSSGDGHVFHAIIKEPFTLSGGNEYSDPGMAGSQGFLESVTQGGIDAWNSLGARVDDWVRANQNDVRGRNSHRLRQVLLQHPGQTILAWGGSARPSFQVPMVFFAVRETDSPLDQVLGIMRGVFPATASGFGTEQGVAPVYVAPLNYTVDRLKAVALEGTVVLEIGNWFVCPDLLIRDVAHSMSPAIKQDDTPIIGEGSITFELYKQIDYATWLGYFPLTTVTP